MSKSKFLTGDRVTIVSNEIQPNMVGKTGVVKKVYESFSEVDGFTHVYRIQVGGTVLKGVALEKDLVAA